MKVLLTLAILVAPLAVASGQEKRSIDDIVAEFKTDPAAAKSKYTKDKVTLEIEVLKRFTESNKVYHQVKASDIPKTARILFRLPKVYRPTDKLVVTAQLKISTWEKDEKVMYWEPVEVIEELQVSPPLYSSGQLLETYLKNQKKVAEQMQGKVVDITGIVRFRANGGVVLEYVPRTNAKGKIEKDIHGFELLGRALVTVRFNDKTAQDAHLVKGTAIEARGTVVEMKAGAIIINDAKLLK